MAVTIHTFNKQIHKASLQKEATRFGTRKYYETKLSNF